MTAADKEKWDRKYAGAAPAAIDPDPWLCESVETIESLSPLDVLELACGLGSNPIWLAEQGHAVTAVDISAVGIAAARSAAATRGVHVTWLEADLDHWRPQTPFDLLCVFRFLDRTSLPAIVDAGLKPGGHLIYETFSRAQLERPDSHIHNPAFTLAHGELESLLPQLETIACREDALPDRTVIRYLGKRVG